MIEHRVEYNCDISTVEDAREQARKNIKVNKKKRQQKKKEKEKEKHTKKHANTHMHTHKTHKTTYTQILREKVAFLKTDIPDIDIIVTGEAVLTGLLNECENSQSELTIREKQALYLEFLPDSDPDVIACNAGFLILYFCF